VTDSRKDSSYLPVSRVPPQDSGLKTRLSAGFFVSEQEITLREERSQEDPLIIQHPKSVRSHLSNYFFDFISISLILMKNL